MIGARTLLTLSVLGLGTAAGPALAGGRTRMGGTLAVVVVGPLAVQDPLLAASPRELALSALTWVPLCRLGHDARSEGERGRLTLARGVSPRAVVDRLAAVSASRYAGLVQALRPELSGTTLTYQAAEAVALCHPALALPVGPFRPGAGRLEAVAELPAGRPYVDGVTVASATERAAERLLLQRRAHVVLGGEGGEAGAPLFVIGLSWGSGLGARFRDALAATVDRADLVRFFVTGPAVPMGGLVPPSLGGPAAAPVRREPLLLPGAAEVTLHYDATAEDHRGIAERLQVKLKQAGYRLALVPHPRAELARLTPGPTDARLVSVMLPASAGAAGAVQRALAGVSLDTPEEDVRFWPLAAKGLAVTAGPDVVDLTRDAHGLPLLEAVSLSPE